MKFLRNPQVKQSVLTFLMITTAASAAALYFDIIFALFVMILCAILLLVHLLFTYHRYKKLESLSYDMDKILHGDDHIPLDCYAEGELGILHSEIYKMTIRLREQRQQLQEDKTFLSDFLADVSHQIRTPLTSLELITALLREPHITDARRNALLREYHALLSRIDTLVTSLLKLSKLDAQAVSFQCEQISLEALLQSATEPLLVPMELREQTLYIRAKGFISCDTIWTKEAIGNIVKNCMEHTPPGGCVDCYADETALYSEIVISDNGIGIEKADLPHVFERFYKGSHANTNSIGIGLSLSRTIITAQNGTIHAENNVDGGAKFIIRFYKGIV